MNESSYDYDPQPAQTPRRGSSRGGDLAAVMLWITGALQGLVFMCCSLAVFVGQSQVSGAEMSRQIMDNMPAEQAGEVEAQTMQKVLPVMLTVMGVTSAVVALLGAVLLALGFAVRRGSETAMMAALIILGLEGIVLSGLMLISLLGSLVGGDLLGAATTLVLVGGLVVLIGVTFFNVLKVRRAGGRSAGVHRYDPDNDLEPWNAHLR